MTTFGVICSCAAVALSVASLVLSFMVDHNMRNRRK